VRFDVFTAVKISNQGLLSCGRIATFRRTILLPSSGRSDWWWKKRIWEHVGSRGR